jgi:hypothetical protein
VTEEGTAAGKPADGTTADKIEATKAEADKDANKPTAKTP